MKYIFHISRYEAEAINPIANKMNIDAEKTALISITEDDEYVDLKNGWKHVLRLHFWDFDDILETKVEEISKEKNLKMTLFEKYHAQEILYFIKNLPENIDTIYIHCEAGVSRSAAVRKFLCDYYGQYCDWLPTKKVPYHDESLTFDDTYNRRVYRILHEVWNNETNTRTD